MIKIEELARRLGDSVPPALREARHDLEENFRAVLRANLSKLDLVSRDDFDVQSKVLERTRAQLETLERRIAELEARLAAGAPADRRD